MKKILAFAVLALMLFAVGCQPQGNDELQSAREAIEEKNDKGEFVFKGKVGSNTEADYIAMDIVDSQVAFGAYHVLVSDATQYFHSDGTPAERSDIQKGDVIEVVFSGQVMQSLPPQIAAQKIYISMD